jgi:predicted transcriptional regulator
MKYRSRIEITSLILDIANGGDSKKTKIMNKAFLSYIQLQERLAFLIERDLLHYDEEAQTFKTTEKGLSFLQMYD